MSAISSGTIALSAIVLGAAALERRGGRLYVVGAVVAGVFAGPAAILAVAIFVAVPTVTLAVGALLLLAGSAGGASLLLRRSRPGGRYGAGHCVPAAAAGILLALIPPALWGPGIIASALGGAAGCALTFALRGGGGRLLPLLAGAWIVVMLMGVALPADGYVGALLALPCAALAPAPYKPRRLGPRRQLSEPTYRWMSARLEFDGGGAGTFGFRRAIWDADVSRLSQLAGLPSTELAERLREAFDVPLARGELRVPAGIIRLAGVPSVPACRRAAVLVERGAELRDWQHRPGTDAPTCSLGAIARARKGLAVGVYDELGEPAEALRQLATAGYDLPVVVQADGMAVARYDGEIVRARWDVRSGHLVLAIGPQAVTVDAGVDADRSPRVLVVDVGYELVDHYKETLSWVKRPEIPPAEHGGVVYVLTESWRWWDTQAMLDAGYGRVVVLRGQGEARVWELGKPRDRVWVQHDESILEVNPRHGEMLELALT